MRLCICCRQETVWDTWLYAMQYGEEFAWDSTYKLVVRRLTSHFWRVTLTGPRRAEPVRKVCELDETMTMIHGWAGR
jgi:hypothetical protein